MTTHSQKLDNSTFKHKVALRRAMLDKLAEVGIDSPTLMETHGGYGHIWKTVYPHLEQGVVFEKDARKVAHLGKQRPTWAVYEGDCIEALAAGVGGRLAIQVVDIDPYGEPWPVMDAFFTSEREFAPIMAVVVNDGLRQALGLGRAWDVKSMADMVLKYGNDLHPIYLEVCRELITEKAAQAGYTVSHFSGYYCGANQGMTHYLAMLRRG